MHDTIRVMLANLGVNVGFAEQCLDLGRLSEQNLLDAIAGASLTTAEGRAEVHELNREIWRLRNLRLRVFDKRSFDRDVVIGLGFNINVVDYAKATGKVTDEQFGEMVVAVCRGKMTVEQVNADLKPTEVAPVTVHKAVETGFSIEELISLGFHHDVLSRCVHSGAVTWDEIDSQARRVRRHQVDAVEVEKDFVEKACRRLSFPRQCQLRERLVRQAGNVLRRAA